MIYLANPSSILDSLKFADGTNLFLLHKDIKVLFRTVNEVLEKVNEWWMSNKHGENIYSLLDKISKKETKN